MKSEKERPMSNNCGHSSKIEMWLQVPVRGVLDRQVVLGDGFQTLVTVIDGVRYESHGMFMGTGDVDAGLADMAIKELQGQLAEAREQAESYRDYWWCRTDLKDRERSRPKFPWEAGGEGMQTALRVKLDATEKERDELRAELAEATVEIEALSGALCDGNDELLRRRKELDEARRLAEEYRNRLTNHAKFMTQHRLPWEGEK